jgi:hypothetical protein
LAAPACACLAAVSSVPAGVGVGVASVVVLATAASAAAANAALKAELSGLVAFKALKMSLWRMLLDGAESSLRVGRCFEWGVEGMMGTHSREGVSFVRVSAVDIVPASASSTSIPWDEGDAASAAVVALSSSYLRAKAGGASLRHFSRARERFGVCGPRSDLEQKPSKASQALANSGRVCWSRWDPMYLRWETSRGVLSVSLDQREDISKCVRV